MCRYEIGSDFLKGQPEVEASNSKRTIGSTCAALSACECKGRVGVHASRR